MMVGRLHSRRPTTVKRSMIAVLALALLIAVAFFLHRDPREQEPQPRPGVRPPVAETAPARGTEAPMGLKPSPSPSGVAPDSVTPEAAPRAVPGTIRGVVRLTGPVPKRKTYRADADPACEAMHGARILSDEFVVDPYGNIQWAFVYVKSRVSGSVPPAPPSPVYMDQVSCVFTPHVVGVRVGQPLVVLNSDNLLHNVHAFALTNKEFNIGLPKAGMEVRRTFDKPEVMIKIRCEIHPWMTSWIGVLDHTYFSITNAVGSYRIPELPPGRYTIEAWQEKCMPSSFLVEVPSGGEATLDFWLEAKRD
jgi:plastocyanin